VTSQNWIASFISPAAQPGKKNALKAIQNREIDVMASFVGQQLIPEVS